MINKNFIKRNKRNRNCHQFRLCFHKLNESCPRSFDYIDNLDQIYATSGKQIESNGNKLQDLINLNAINSNNCRQAKIAFFQCLTAVDNDKSSSAVSDWRTVWVKTEGHRVHTTTQSENKGDNLARNNHPYNALQLWVMTSAPVLCATKGRTRLKLRATRAILRSLRLLKQGR